MTEHPLSTKLPWWRDDLYTKEDALPEYFEQLAGPKSVALVKVWPDGRTDQGWGMKGPKSDPDNGFMPRYKKDEFNSRRVLYGYNHGRWAFAVIMRSVRLVCIDIDGKNGGLEHAKRLGLLPHTLAETSKSGNGFHLFYEVEDEWDEDAGYDGFTDHIGIEQGVDIRSVGCVYHHAQQRWNHRVPAKLPKHLHDLMLAARQRRTANAERVTKILSTNDDLEVLMLQTELAADLAKPIPSGKRNTTLFAIGQKMKQAGIPGWDEALEKRALELGLDVDEVDKLVSNVKTYD